MNEYNESMEKRKRWILSITIGCFLIIFFSQKINAQGMVLEFMDHYYHGIMTGFFPAVSKKEVTFSGNILSDMVCMYYQETVPILQYRTDYKDKVVSCKKMGKFKIFKKIYLSDRQYDNGDRK